ncbi:MAG: orotidine-5'-phosphate decarboxylase [Chloroflexota bacterium]
MTYLEKLRAAQSQNNSWLCVGLDPQPSRLPLPAVHWDEPVLPFCRAIIEATADLACAYKPNLGFFLQWGAAGVIALERTLAFIPDHLPTILDCKTGDIGSTQAAWAAGLLDEWGVDAVTVNPYVGAEAVMPMLEGRPDKAVYLLARTSNPSAPQFQDLEVAAEAQRTQRGVEARLWLEVIRQSQEWVAGSESKTEQVASGKWQVADGESKIQNPKSKIGKSKIGALGYVVGATYPEELALARQLAPTANFLIPGVGAQGGDLTAAVRHGPDSIAGPVINASRAILYASAGLDFAEAARAAAMALRDEIYGMRIA